MGKGPDEGPCRSLYKGTIETRTLAFGAGRDDFVRAVAVLTSLELRSLRRTGQRGRRRRAPGNHLRDFIEVTRAHKTLMRHGAVT
jgi:hypothetical protein